MPEAHIIGLGHYVPENIVTNDDLSKVIDTSDQWIIERTGIEETNLTDHIKRPIIFLIKQIGILIPFFFIESLTL